MTCVQALKRDLLVAYLVMDICDLIYSGWLISQKTMVHWWFNQFLKFRRYCNIYVLITKKKLVLNRCRPKDSHNVLTLACYYKTAHLVDEGVNFFYPIRNGIYSLSIIASGRTIKRELEHLVEVRPTGPVRTAFEIFDYFKCEISEWILWNYAAKTYKNNRTLVKVTRNGSVSTLISKQIYCVIFGAPIHQVPRYTACLPAHAATQ